MVVGERRFPPIGDRMTENELARMIAAAVQTAVSEKMEKPKAEKSKAVKAKAKAVSTGQPYVKFEKGDRDGILKAVKYWPDGGFRSLCSLSVDNWALIKAALNK
jgi:hypothetical protein